MNTDVEDLLRQGMERFTADLRAPAGLTRRVARRRRRRLARRSGAAVAAALVAGAAMVAVVLPGAGTTGIRGRIAPAAYVVKRVDSALSAADPGAIAHMMITTRSASGPGVKTTTTTAELWSRGDQWRSVRNSPGGRTVYDEGSSGDFYTLVTYQTRTWARQHRLGAPYGAGRASSPRDCGPLIAGLPLLFQPGLEGINFSGDSQPSTVARSLRATISCGTLTVAGRQRVDGTEAVKLTSRRGSPISETIWVSPGTYLPVRLAIRSALGFYAPGEPAPGRLTPGTPAAQLTADITWLPPTPQNLAQLTVPIPAGFRRVPLLSALVPLVSQLPGPKPGKLCLVTRAQSLCKRLTGASGYGPARAGHPTLAVPRPSGPGSKSG
ncbi:MAG: hypothetical protein ACRDPO_14540 [Streptosporangiaceae bacterium]